MSDHEQTDTRETPSAWDYLAAACHEKCREYNLAPRTQATEAVQTVLSDLAACFAVAAKMGRDQVSDEILDLIVTEVTDTVANQLTAVLGTNKPTTRKKS